MVIALDYDDTYTKDPVLWLSYIDLALERGHEVFVVTMRSPMEKHKLDPVLMEKIPSYFTSGYAKRPFMDKEGISIDVWIDDNPHYVDQDHLIINDLNKWFK